MTHILRVELKRGEENMYPPYRKTRRIKDRHKRTKSGSLKPPLKCVILFSSCTCDNRKYQSRVLTSEIEKTCKIHLLSDLI